MRKIFAISAVLFLLPLLGIFMHGACPGEDITFAWKFEDPNAVFDGFYLYQKENAGGYDFNSPVSGLIGTGERQHILKDVRSGPKQWVIRAKAGNLYSDSSNEVFLYVPLIPPSGIAVEP